MKKFVLFISTIMLLVFLTSCDSEITGDVVSVKPNSARTFVDFFEDKDELPWGETVEVDVPEFMSTTTFQWNIGQFIATKDDEKTILITGMPIWNVFMTDLNNDDMPEFCATIGFGSSIVDKRVIVVDYANDKTYEISDRMTYDYHLSKPDEELIITRTPYPYDKNKNNDNLTGKLSIENQQIIIKYKNGEMLSATAADITN